MLPIKTIHSGRTSISHDYPNIVNALLQSLGGRENIEQAAHCVTRLRLALKNPALVNSATLNQIDLVKGSFFSPAGEVPAEREIVAAWPDRFRATFSSGYHGAEVGG